MAAPVDQEVLDDAIRYTGVRDVLAAAWHFHPRACADKGLPRPATFFNNLSPRAYIEIIACVRRVYHCKLAEKDDERHRANDLEIPF